MEITQIKEILSELFKQLPDDTDWDRLRHELPPLVTVELDRRRGFICIFCEESEEKISEIGEAHKINLNQVKRMILKGITKHKINTIKPFVCEFHLKQKDVIKICENREIRDRAKNNIKAKQFAFLDFPILQCRECHDIKVCKSCLHQEMEEIIKNKYSKI